MIPQNIFKIMNDNILAIAEDLNTMHKKVDMLKEVFYPEGDESITEPPKADGNAPVKV